MVDVRSWKVGVRKISSRVFRRRIGSGPLLDVEQIELGYIPAVYGRLGAYRTPSMIHAALHHPTEPSVFFGRSLCLQTFMLGLFRRGTNIRTPPATISTHNNKRVGKANPRTYDLAHGYRSLKIEFDCTFVNTSKLRRQSVLSVAVVAL